MIRIRIGDSERVGPAGIDDDKSWRCHSFIQNGYFKTFPPADELDGFFAARLRKTS